MLTSIAGKSVVVTGASMGIGKGIARVFARNGAKVTIVARHRAEAKAAAKELGGDASAGIADVTNLAELEKMAKSAARRNGGIDVLCANAGIFPQARIEDMSPEQWNAVLATNLKGTFLAVKACVPYLKESAAGRIVITSSITGPITGFPAGRITERRNPASSAFCALPRSSLRNTGSPSTRSCPATSSPRGWSTSGRNTTKPWPPRSH
jgi:3-oxoacyl-[acyl-carrier protein] reductase